MTNSLPIKRTKVFFCDQGIHNVIPCSRCKEAIPPVKPQEKYAECFIDDTCQIDIKLSKTLGKYIHMKDHCSPLPKQSKCIKFCYTKEMWQVNKDCECQPSENFPFVKYNPSKQSWEKKIEKIRNDLVEAVFNRTIYGLPNEKKYDKVLNEFVPKISDLLLQREKEIRQQIEELKKAHKIVDTDSACIEALDDVLALLSERER